MDVPRMTEGALTLLFNAVTRVERERTRSIVARLMAQTNPSSSHGKAQMTALRRVLQELKEKD